MNTASVCVTNITSITFNPPQVHTRGQSARSEGKETALVWCEEPRHKLLSEKRCCQSASRLCWSISTTSCTASICTCTRASLLTQSGWSYEHSEDPEEGLFVFSAFIASENSYNFTQSGWKTLSVLPIFTASKQVEMRLWNNQINCWSGSSLKIVFKQDLAFFIFIALLAFKCMSMILLTSYHYRNAPDSFTKLTGGNWKYSSAFSISFFISILFWPVKLFRCEMKISSNMEFWRLQRKRRIILKTLFNLTCNHQRKEDQKNPALSW